MRRRERGRKRTNRMGPVRLFDKESRVEGEVFLSKKELILTIEKRV
jgi:hypothetical protein